MVGHVEMLNTIRIVPSKDFSHSRLTSVPRDSTAARLNLVTSSIAYTTVSGAGSLAAMVTAESEIMKTVYVSDIVYPIPG